MAVTLWRALSEKDGAEPRNVMVESDEQFQNASMPMLLTVVGMVLDCRESHQENMELLIRSK